MPLIRWSCEMRLLSTALKPACSKRYRTDADVKNDTCSQEAKAPAGAGEAGGEARDVAGGDDSETSVANEAAHPAGERARVSQVLERVDRDHGVEGPVR